jgi:hypothetical protein
MVANVAAMNPRILMVRMTFTPDKPSRATSPGVADVLNPLVIWQGERVHGATRASAGDVSLITTNSLLF